MIPVLGQVYTLYKQKRSDTSDSASIARREQYKQLQGDLAKEAELSRMLGYDSRAGGLKSKVNNLRTFKRDNPRTFKRVGTGIIGAISTGLGAYAVYDSTSLAQKERKDLIDRIGKRVLRLKDLQPPLRPIPKPNYIKID